MRFAHYALLLGATALLTLPNLGAPSLWDVDEGVNAGCTREMLESGSWVVPTFNAELRTAKPVMLYWIQRASYNAFGITEWSARFPAVLLGLGTVLLVYELGRRMFDAGTGLLAGIILASAIEFCKLSHAATPDAPLIFFTTLALYLFWRLHENGGRHWFAPCAVAAGLAVLTKGPVGVALPGAVILGTFLWNREAKRLLDWRLLAGALAFLLVAAPWYGLVIAETRGAYLAFFRNENANRFLNAMEGHRGPVVYYVGALVAFFAPWSVFLGGSLWYAVKESSRPTRFLLVWFAAYLVFFSVAATKLPNYIAPLYPAVALLTARFLVRWREGAVAPAAWVMPTASVGVGIVGVVIAAALLVAGGIIPLDVKGLRVMPGLAPWAALGGIFVAASVAMLAFLRANNRPAFVRTVALAACLFVGLTAAFPVLVVDAYKAPRDLVRTSGADDTAREMRLASLDYTQPSVTFYAGRPVERLKEAVAVDEFLRMPLPAMLFVPEPVWRAQLEGKLTAAHAIAARRFDFYRNCEVLVVRNGACE